ncbi:30S ribosomal protein S27ae [Candidatus Woesearchaeota archaeon]|nr:30S ribosomal protein S27ae [Candidatus Woesearchaeota archaeon]
MAAPNKGGKAPAKAAAKGPAKKKSRSLHKLYVIEGDKIKRTNPFSPKSPGDFLASHKDRLVCGKTGYTEMKRK